MATTIRAEAPATRTIDWIGLIPYALIHLGVLGVFFVGWSPSRSEPRSRSI